MICHYCKVNNPDEAKFCRDCGQSLQMESAIKRYADYHFIPITLFRLKVTILAKFFLAILTPFILGSIVLIIYSILSLMFMDVSEYESKYYPSSYESDTCKKCKEIEIRVNDIGWGMFEPWGRFVYSPDGICRVHNQYNAIKLQGIKDQCVKSYIRDYTLILLLMSAVLFVCGFIIVKYELFIKSFPNKFRRKHLLKIADYIQIYKSPKEKFVFFLKDNKFGLYNVKQYKVQVVAEYDSMIWEVKGSTLNVQHNEIQYVIDVYGNKLK